VGSGRADECDQGCPHGGRTLDSGASFPAYADLEIKQKDPDLAQRLGYLDLKGGETTRAVCISGVDRVVVWEE
jgi:hypothetical protein